MIIICAYCKPQKVIGYKCHRCRESLSQSKGTKLGDEIICPWCEFQVRLTKGGTTHGICPDCKKEQLGKLEEGK